jgi:hypothetical protein
MDCRNNPARACAVVAGAGVDESFTRHGAQAESVVEFTIGEQSGVGGHDRSAKLQHQAAVEILRASPLDSPAGFVMMASIKGAQSTENYASIVRPVQENGPSSGECGFR